MFFYLETKQKIIAVYINQLRTEIKNLEQNIEEAKQEAIKAPGRMEARYDVRKEEETQKHDHLQKLGQEKTAQMNKINELAAVEQTQIDFGALFQTDDGKNFLVLEGGGKIKIDDEEIIIIGTAAPIFEKIKNLRINENFVWPNGRTSLIIKMI